MLVKKIEKRNYPRLEMAEIMELNPSDKNFATKVKSRLDKWGYGYEYSRNKVTITSIPQTAEEKLKELLFRKFNLDKQIDIISFAVVFFLLVNDEDFASSPWLTRISILKDEYGIVLGDSTPRNWVKHLIEEDVLYKDKYAKNIWRTYKDQFGIKYQERLPEEAYDEYLDYQNLKFQYLKDVKDFYKENNITENPWKEVFRRLWQEKKCCYYNVKNFLGGAFYDDTDILEIFELTEELFLNLPPREELPLPVPKTKEFVF